MTTFDSVLHKMETLSWLQIYLQFYNRIWYWGIWKRVCYETEQYKSNAFCVFACVEIKGLVIVLYQHLFSGLILYDFTHACFLNSSFCVCIRWRWLWWIHKDTMFHSQSFCCKYIRPKKKRLFIFYCSFTVPPMLLGKTTLGT
jgi:hypothetical protein